MSIASNTWRTVTSLPLPCAILDLRLYYDLNFFSYSFLLWKLSPNKIAIDSDKEATMLLLIGIPLESYWSKHSIANVAWTKAIALFFSVIDNPIQFNAFNNLWSISLFPFSFWIILINFWFPSVSDVKVSLYNDILRNHRAWLYAENRLVG